MMTEQQLLIYLVVFAVGIPSARKNATALALVASWMVGEATWLLTGNSLPLSTYFMADVAVISFIYAKTIRRVGSRKYPTVSRQLYCLVMDLTIWDRWIVGIFILGMWPAYVLNLDPYTKWQALYWFAILQFMLAGAEACSMLRLKFREQSSDPPGNGLALAGVTWRDG